MISFNTSNQTYRQLMGNGLLYSIPRFQRDYSWTEEEWEDLWAGLMEAVSSEYDGGHYMGYLVLQSNDSKRFDVVDGQQRLTTISLIILGVLANLNRLVEKGIEAANNKQRESQLRNAFIGYLDPVTLIPKSKLTLNRNNDFIYQNFLVPLQPAPKRNLKATEHLLRKGFDWFNQRIEQEWGVLQDGSKLALLIDRLSDRLFFTVISVNDELNAYKVFETLNVRGVKLSSTDLLKNYLFSMVHKTHNDEQTFKILDDRWERLSGELGSENFSDFLRTCWNSRYPFVRHSDLFKRVREKVDSLDKVFDLMRALERDVEPFSAFSKPEDELWSAEQRVSIKELNLFSVRQLYPLLLAAYRLLPPAEFSDLLKVCVVITFRYNVIGGLTPNEQERVYHVIAEKIANGTLNTLSKIVLEFKSVYVSDTQFKTAFAEKVFKTTNARNKKIVRYILFKLEKEKSGHDMEIESPDINLEHILPENPDTGWDHIEDHDHEKAVYRISNMTLMKTSANRAIGNADFENKKAAYATSAFEITKELADEPGQWGIGQIANRQRNMAKCALTIWKVSQLS
jgi:hypothetical protein